MNVTTSNRAQLGGAIMNDTDCEIRPDQFNGELFPLAEWIAVRQAANENIAAIECADLFDESIVEKCVDAYHDAMVNKHRGNTSPDLRFATETGDRAPDRDWIPYPLEQIPDPLASYVEDQADAIGCHPVMIAMPLLTAAAAAIGDTRVLRAKGQWNVPSILWSMIVSESGTAKTPAFRAALTFTRERERKLRKEYEETLKAWQVEFAEYKSALQRWKKKPAGEEPDCPPQPPMPRVLVSDTTIQAIAPILNANARGILLGTDELSGWFGSFDKFNKGAASGDTGYWLSMYCGEPIIRDRITGDHSNLYVPRALCSITGGIQPGILRRTLSNEHQESGLAARFLFVMPPRRKKHWQTNEPSLAIAETVRGVFEFLNELKFVDNEHGEPEAAVLTLDDEARKLYGDWYDRHQDETLERVGTMAAAWSKLEEIPLRLALVFHLIRCATGEPVQQVQVDRESMQRAIAVANWHKRETDRVYSSLHQSEAERDRMDLIDYIKQKGGTITVRELQRNRRQFKTADDADKALTDLVNSHHGFWSSDHSKREFQIA